MQVRLMKDVIEGETRNAVNQVVKEGQLKRSVRTGRPVVEWKKGAVIDMSETSARKYIDAGFAEAMAAK